MNSTILEKIYLEQAIKLIDPFNKITGTTKEIEWLEYNLACKIWKGNRNAAEKNLSVIFPDDYKNFLMITNGFTFSH
jgi:hypothetical protein